jgi:protocatechuate 3,4-dioxygenase beta subunit
MLRGLLLVIAALSALAQDAGAISGLVLDDLSVPVPSLKIVLTSTQDRTVRLTATTNAAGEFRFDGLVPRTYTATVEDNQPYRAPNSAIDRGAFQASTVRAGETSRIQFSVFRPAVITGTIRDTYGDPIPNTTVQVMRYTIQDRRLYLGVGASGRTDDRGIYRISGIRPGRYYVQVAVRPTPTSQTTTLPTFYGNTTERSRAKPIAITAGAQIDGMDVTVAAVRTYTLRGRLFFKDGSPVVGDQLMVIPNDGSMGQGGPVLQTANDGTFTTRLVPGRYAVVPGGSPVRISSAKGPPPPEVRGYHPITVANADLSVDLTVSAGEQVTGTIQIEGGSPLSESMRATISLRSLEPTDLAGPRTINVTAKPDGSFEFSKLIPTRYFLSVSSTSPETYFKSINGERVTLSQPVFLDIKFDTPSKLDIVLSTKVATISGKLPVRALVVARPILDSDPDAWNPYAIQTATSQPDGAFRLAGLAPGKYSVTAFDATHPEVENLIFDPAFLRQFEGTTLELAEDARAGVEPTIIPRQAIAEVFARLP